MVVCILGCVNLSFAYVEGESLLMALKDVALSSGRYNYYLIILLVLALSFGRQIQLYYSTI